MFWHLKRVLLCFGQTCTFLTSFAIFQSFTDLFRELSDREISNHYKMNSEMSKLGVASSFDPHSMCKRVERVTAKTGCTSRTNWAISFGVSWFRTRTHPLQRHFIFLTYFNSRLFVRSTCTIQRHIINFQPFLTSFAIFHEFTNYFEL